jgi:four helix bundle protein
VLAVGALGWFVPANIAEGYGRYSDGANRNHLSIAGGSLFETQSWLDLLARRDISRSPRSTAYLRYRKRCRALLTATIRTIKATKATIKEEGVKYEA